MNSTDGLALFLGFLLLAGSISFVYRWSKGSVSDAQGLFGVAGIAVAFVFPAFIAPDLYKELFVGLRYLIVVPVGTVAAAVPISGVEAVNQTATATANGFGRLWGRFTGAIGNMFSGLARITEFDGGKRFKKRA